MDDRELEVRVAHDVMGWRFVRQGGMRVDSFLLPPDEVAWYIDKYVITKPTDEDFQHDGKATRVPKFSTDIGAAMQVEDRIEQIGKCREYCDALARVVGVTNLGVKDFWNLIHATPRQRCLAALATTEGKA